MTDFELGIQRAVSIYTAGLMGAPVPFYTGMRVSDVEELYTAGVCACLDEIDACILEKYQSRTPQGKAT